MQDVNAGARLDRLPISRFHYRILALIAAGMFVDGFSIYLQGPVLATLLDSKWSTPRQNANFVSATLAGMLLGAYAAGILGDRYGRRFSYQFNLLVFGVAALAGAFAPTMVVLTCTRAFMGLGLGAEIVAGYVALSELVPPASRGRWGAALALLTNTSLLFATLVSRLVIPRLGWRWMFIIVSVLALIVWHLRKALPESPRWLESQGRLDEAEAALGDIERDALRTSGAPLPPAHALVASAVAADPLSMGSLFRSPLLARTVTGSLLLIALNSAVYGFITFIPMFMISQGKGIIAALNFATLVSIGAPLGALLGLLLADRLGRRHIILIFTPALILLGLAYPRIEQATGLALDGFLVVLCVYVLAAIAWSLYVPELFPTPIRMRGVGFCNTAGRLFAIATPQAGLLLYRFAGVSAVITYICTLLLIQLVVVAFYGHETSGASLENVSRAISDD